VVFDLFGSQPGSPRASSEGAENLSLLLSKNSPLERGL